MARRRAERPDEAVRTAVPQAFWLLASREKSLERGAFAENLVIEFMRVLEKVFAALQKPDWQTICPYERGGLLIDQLKGTVHFTMNQILVGEEGREVLVVASAKWDDVKKIEFHDPASHIKFHNFAKIRKVNRRQDDIDRDDHLHFQKIIQSSDGLNK